MKLLGVDFTSAPSNRKPITVAEGNFNNRTLTIIKIHRLTSFEQFEDFLDQKGPWMAGMDFPFGLPGAFLSALGLPHDWPGYVQALTRRPRSEFEKKIKRFKSRHASPYKEPLRFTDLLASAQSPLKLVNPPVARMFYEGASRLFKSGASILPGRPKKGSRIILEAYPALIARRYAKTYKSEGKDTAGNKTARRKIIIGIMSSGFEEEFGFSMHIDDSLQTEMLTDFKGDSLDAVLCAAQCAWGYRQGKPDYGVPARSRNLLKSEGWILDPGLGFPSRAEEGPKTQSMKSANKAGPLKDDKSELMRKLGKLMDIGLALSGERNLDILLDMIMQEARNFTHADGGTLYILSKDNKLHYKIFQNETLDIRMGGKSGEAIPFPALAMNPSNVSSYVAMSGQSVNIPNIRNHKEHDFSGPWKFDKKFNYRTQSMLLVPMKNKEEEVIGVIQLVNARKSGKSKTVIAFTHENVRWIQSLASQAAVAITHVYLVQETLRAAAEVARARDMAMEANTAKGRFLANMTHELRTPMNAIIGYTEMLMEETEERNLTDIHQDLEKIENSAKILMQLINDVLDLSKIEAGKMEIHLESFKIEELAQSTLVIIEPMVQKTKNKLEVQWGDNLGFMVADKSWVRQTLTNLLSNACKFTEDGKVSLEVTRVKRNDDPWIIFKVRDTGIGIPRDRIPSLFMEFTQAHSASTRKFGGTGLGLAISQRFCRMMGGNISVQSEVDQGTTFTVELPAKVIPFIEHPCRRASDRRQTPP